jgi:hypothetical protein
MGTTTNEEDLAQEVLEAQLRHTSSLITRSLTTHPHFTDDCGEYLRSALELAAYLASAREDGVEALLASLDELSKLQEDASEPDDYILYENYATDGIAPEVLDFIRHLAESR